jgi:hypothetical protein
MTTPPPTVKVMVDTSTSPPTFSFVPLVLVVDQNYKDVVHWDRVGSNFEFAALAFDHPNPFRDIVVTDAEITAIDTHPSKEDHAYSILIRVGKQYFSSADTLRAPGPIIRNN